MVNFSDVHDIGARLKAADGGLDGVWMSTASTGENGVEKTGTIVDRHDNGDRFQSAKVVVSADVTSLPANHTVQVLYNLQHSSSTVTSNFADFNDVDGTTGQTLTLTTAADRGVGSADFDLGTAKRYLRLQMTPTLLDSNSSEADLATGDEIVVGPPVIVFGGGDFDPAS